MMIPTYIAIGTFTAILLLGLMLRPRIRHLLQIPHEWSILSAILCLFGFLFWPIAIPTLIFQSVANWLDTDSK